MIQQTLLQSYDNIRNRLRSLGESIPDRDLINSAKATNSLKESIQPIYNPHKKNEDISWIEASGKKRNRNSPEMTMSRK